MQSQRYSFTTALLLSTLLFFTLCLFGFSMLSPDVVQAVDSVSSVSESSQVAPDLLVAAVAISTTNGAAETLGTVTISIQNRGDDIAAGFGVYFYLDPMDAPPTATTTETQKTFVNVPLAAGDIFTWTLKDYPFSSSQPPLYIWVDPPWENQVTESNEENNLYSHLPAQAAITAITPAVGEQDTTLTVRISATNTNFLTDVTTADLEDGILVNEVTVQSSTDLLLSLTIQADARPGTRTVTLTTGNERVSKMAAFTVMQPAMPVILGDVQPSQGDPGTVLDVTVNAENSHFVAGRTNADFGAGIVISNVQVISETAAIVTVAIAADAAPGLRAVSLSTGTEVAARSGAFRVNAQHTNGGAILYIDPTPATLYVSETHTLTVVLAPGVTPINAFQIHGRVDPAYLRLTDAISHVTSLNQAPLPLQFDSTTGEFQYSVGELSQPITETIPVLSLELLPLQPTDEAGTPVEFLSEPPATDVSGPDGSVLEAAHNGLVLIGEHSNLAQLHGRADLQGRPFRPQAAWSIGLTVELIPSTQGVASIKKIVQTNERGEFIINDLPVDSYTIWLKGEHTLANRVENVTVVPGKNEIYLGTLLEGDIETDTSYNSVTIKDFSLLSGTFHRCQNDRDFLPNADLNEDGCITIEDSTLVYANFNQQGDIVYDYKEGIPIPLPSAARKAEVGFATVQTTATISDVIVLPLFVDPKDGDSILGVTVALQFDPALVEIPAYSLAGLPDYVLTSTIDNNQGMLRFSLQFPPDEAIDSRFQVATVSVKLQENTTIAQLTPTVDGLRGTNVVGNNGSLLATATGITLINKDVIQSGHRVLLPLVSR